MQKLVGIVVGLLFCVCVAQSADEQTSVRERFVPTADGTTPQSYGGVTNWSQLGPLDETAWREGKVPVSTGANWSRLGPGPGEEAGVLFLMAHAGISDTFPVQDEHGRTLFVVIVVAGDDDHLLLVVRSKEGSHSIDLRRGKSVPVQVGAGKYDLLYPSVSMAAAKNAKPTTSKTMIIVLHRPS